jgi:multiple sugar transport system permease protein
MTTAAGLSSALAARAASSGAAGPRRRRIRRLAALRTAVQAAVIVLWCLLPVYWLVVSAFRDPSTTFELTPLPTRPTLANFVAAFDPTDLLLRGIANSAMISGGVTLVSLVIGATAAYGLARWTFRGRDLLLGALLAASMLPGASLATPLYGVWAALGWSYSYQAIALPYLALTLPLTVFTLQSFFQGLPWDLEDAARVDGCTRPQAFLRVILPLAAPSVFTAAILSFLATWNEYVLATVLTGDRTITVTVVIGDFAADITGYTVTMAAGAIVTVPLIALVLLFQRRIVSGLTAGAVRA